VRVGIVAVALVLAGCGGSTLEATTIVGHSGKLVPAGNHLLYVECTGSGSPTVVLDSGGEGGVESWIDVQPRIAQFTRVCSYDRAGNGLSPVVPGVRTASDQADDLARLVAQLGEKRVVIVGHSWGGLVDRLFASSHADSVAGVVLVDASVAGAGALHHSFEGLDIGRSLAEVAQVRSLGNVPLVVLTAGRYTWPAGFPQRLRAPFAARWLRLQDGLARLSTNTVHAVGLYTDHGAFLTYFGQPEVVATATKAVVEAVRTGDPLPACGRVFQPIRARCR
jgi:pimeloyl-ACP methyl ester carboxylesterase